MTSANMQILQDQNTLFRAAAERVVQIAEEAIADHDHFFVALSGGSTPKGLYGALAEPAFADRIDWSRTRVYFGDERCVPPDHPDSNYGMAWTLLLSRVPIPASHVHRIQGEHPPKQAAEDYARLLSESVPRDEHGRPQFDLVLLGMGLDGHVASLFPETDAFTERGKSVVPVFVEKLGAWRVTLTLPTLDNARHVMLLVAGAGKADVLKRALGEPPGSGALPVQRLSPRGGVEWLVDEEAGRLLGRVPDA